MTDKPGQVGAGGGLARRRGDAEGGEFDRINRMDRIWRGAEAGWEHFFHWDQPIIPSVAEWIVRYLGLFVSGSRAGGTIWAIFVVLEGSAEMKYVGLCVVG
jgi:hypothetical protein